jgi:hypothetical protein
MSDIGVIVLAGVMVPSRWRGTGVPCSELSSMTVEARDLAVVGVGARWSVIVSCNYCLSGCTLIGVMRK